jgi:hypothetical protein
MQTPKIVLSTFCKSRDQKACKIPLETIVGEVTANFPKAKPGYRDGVLLVPISPENFVGQIATLRESTTLLSGTFIPRQPEEPPRKQFVVDQQPDELVAVDIVLYSNATLAENNENSDKTADFEIIAILTKISEEDQPLSPETLMANHFGESGGTSTKMLPEGFVAALEKSYNFWKNKAIVKA